MKLNYLFVKYYRFSILIYCLFFLFSNLIVAQNEDSVLTARGNIISYKEKLGIYLYGISKMNSFELGSPDYNANVRYNPNENFNIGFGFNYKWLGTSLAFNLGFINNDKDLYGDSKGFDSQLDIYTKKYYFNFGLQAYQGYYWKNPSDIIKGWDINDSALVRPDIKTFTIGTSGIYVFNNDNFSFKATYQNTERQINSAGSWLVGLKLSLYSIEADSSLVPEIVQKHFATSINIGGISVLSLGGSGGCAYTFIIKDYFYINMALMLGLSVQTSTIYNLSGNATATNAKTSSNVLIRMGLGCNKPKYFYGISLSSDSFFIRNPDDAEFTYSYGKFKIYYGRRFSLK